MLISILVEHVAGFNQKKKKKEVEDIAGIHTSQEQTYGSTGGVPYYGLGRNYKRIGINNISFILLLLVLLFSITYDYISKIR